MLGIGVEDGFKNFPHLYLDPQFLIQLPLQGLPRLFSLHHFPSWKFPEKSMGSILFSLCDEDFTLFNDDTRCHDDGFHLIPLLGSDPRPWPDRGRCLLHGLTP